MSDSASPAMSSSNDNMAWAMIWLIFCVVAGIEIADPFSIEPLGFIPLIMATATLGAASIFYKSIRPRENFVAMFTGLVQALLFTALGSLLSYMLARYSGALWDSELERWDAALGFNWMEAAYFLDAHPWVLLPLELVYPTLIPQVVVLILAFGFSGKIFELRRFIFSAIISGTIIILMSPFFVAISNYIYHGIDGDTFQNLRDWPLQKSKEDLLALRYRTMTHLNLLELEGFITFPSYHAGLATITCWGFWATRMRFIQIVGGIIAIMTIVATPIEGGHYLVDVIVGCLIGAFAVAISRPAVKLNLSRVGTKRGQSNSVVSLEV